MTLVEVGVRGLHILAEAFAGLGTHIGLLLVVAGLLLANLGFRADRDVGSETLRIDEGALMLRALNQNLVYHLQVLHLLPFGIGDAFHVASIVDVPVRGLVALRLLLEANKGDFTCLLGEIQGLGSVLNECIGGYLGITQLSVLFIPFFSNCKFFGFAANNDTRNIEQSDRVALIQHDVDCLLELGLSQLLGGVSLRRFFLLLLFVL